MRRRGRVDDEALDVRDVGQQGEDLQVVDEAVRLGLAARDLKGEDGAAAVREVLLIQRVVRVARQRRMVDARDLRVRRQPRDDLLRVLRVAVEAQRERLDALQQQEGVERGDGRAGVAQENGADVGHKSGLARGLHERDAVVAGVRCGELRIAGAGSPVERTGVDDDAAERRAVAAEELRGGVDDDVRAERDPVGRAERVVDDERQAVAVGDGGNGLDVRDVAVRVAQRLKIDGARVRLDGRLDRCGVVRVHERCRDAVLRQRVRQQVIGAAVDRLLRDDVVALPRKRLNGIGDGRCAGGRGQSGHAALKGRHALLKHVLRGVRQAAVDVARVRQAEAGRSLCAVTEYIGRRLVDGHGARAGGGIGLLLSDVKLQGLKMIAHGDVSFVILSDRMDGIFPSAGIPATKKPGLKTAPGQRNGHGVRLLTHGMLRAWQHARPVLLPGSPAFVLLQRTLLPPHFV